MSTTLTLIDAGWESVQLLAERGQRMTALKQLTRLLARPDLPAALAVEGNKLAGKLALELENYTISRRHLKAAAKLEPEHAETHYTLGRAWEEDPDGCDRRAAICYKKATMHDATNSLYRAAFGRAAARCGKVKLGSREMLAAAEQATGDVAVVRIAVTGLLEMGNVSEARQVVARARFLRPGNSELAAMWERIKFESARTEQQQLVKSLTVRDHTPTAQDARFATDGARTTLPFMRLAEGTAQGATVRRDVASCPRPHIARLRARKADR